VVIGRDEERRALAALVDACRAGVPQAVVVRGEPGIGKTALLDDLQDRARDCTVLRAAAVEPEREIPLAVLLSLLAPVRERIADLVPHHRDVLAAVVSTGEPAAPAAMGLALLDLLSRLSDERPLLVVLDDAHWADEASLEVLHFARRRLHGHRVAVVEAVRPGTALVDQHVAVLDLRGLGADGTRELLAVTGEVTDDVADRCRHACAGNPLALLELGRTLSPAQRQGRSPLPEVFPVGDRLGAWLSARVASLPEPSQHALAVLALTGTVGPGVLGAALDTLGLGLADLDPAQEAGVLERRKGVIELTHPLYGTIAIEALRPADRRAAHRALAQALPEQLLERRAWHLAEGVEGDAAEAVAALEQAAERAEEQGAHLTASEAWARAARLLDGPAEQSRRLTAAGTAAWSAGRPDVAVPLLREARALVPPGPVRAAATAALGEVLGWSESIPEAMQLLEAEVPHVDGTHPALAVELLITASRLGTLAASPKAVALAEEAERTAVRGSDLERVAARAMATHARLLRGDSTEALGHRLAELDGLGALTEGCVGRPMLELGQLLGFDLMVRERWGDARSMFGRVVDSARAASLLGVEAFASAMAAEVAWRTGRWSEARAEALVEATFHASVEALHGSFGDATLARVEAAMGLIDSARDHATVAIRRGEELEMSSLVAWGRHGLGLAALAAGEPTEALAPLEWIWHLERSGSVSDPGVLWWHGDLLETLLLTGRGAEARRLVDYLREAAASTDRRWAAAISARGEGILDTTPRALERSAALLDDLGAPFEAARSRLALADVASGRARQRALDAALRAFEALGARPWADRVLGRLGEGAERPATPAAAAVLSPAELRVALAVGRGLTNRQAADALALSPRTVDAHLQSIYRKLRIRSRTQLALRMRPPGA
jgi:DNA-binding CsgD family transcriptional regulator